MIKQAIIPLGGLGTRMLPITSVIPKELLQISDIKAKIPMYGKIDSLNVSVASGVILYEAIKQRNNSSLI